VGLNLNGTHQLLVYLNVVNPLEITKYHSEEGGLEVNSLKTKYMFMSRHQNAR
jgi:hypothetical protein